MEVQFNVLDEKLCKGGIPLRSLRYRLTLAGPDTGVVWIRASEAEYTSFIKMIIPDVYQNYDLKVYGLKEILRRWGHSDFVIELEKETSDYINGSSLFAQEIRSIMQHEGSWFYELHKGLLDIDTPRYWSQITATERFVTWMELRREVKLKAHGIMEETFKASNSPLRLFDITLKMTLNVRQKISLSKLVNMSTFHVACCSLKYADLEHYLIHCTIVRDAFPDLPIVMRTPVNRWANCHIETITNVTRYIDSFVKSKLTRHTVD